MLEHDTHGGGDGRVVDGVQAERQYRAPPVDGLGDRRQLLELHSAQHSDDAHQLFGNVAGQFGYAGQQDSAFQVGAGEVDVQEQAATFERFGQFAGGVGGQHHERRPLGGDGAQLGDRHGEVRQHLQQQTLDFDVGLVGLVDQQHGGFGAPDRGQQRTGEQKLLSEDVGLGLVPVIGAGLDTQNLLGVVPLVEGTGLVDTFVALQADQTRSSGLRDGAGQLGLTNTGRAFDQKRLAEPVGQENRGGGGGIGQVAGFGQPTTDIVDIGEQRDRPRGHT